MPRVRQEATWPEGELVHIMHHSQVLEGNPWGDPCLRRISVYLPHGYDKNGVPYVSLWDLAAFTNSGPGHLNWRHQGENLPQRLDRLIFEGKLPPVIVIFPDCYTSLGGNQYVNSVSVGPYADYLNNELLPLVSRKFNVVDDASGRGAFGKSSGGYGAMSLAMRYPKLWGAVASHAGDVGFDLVYRPEFPLAAAMLNECKGNVVRFLEQFWRNKNPGKAHYSTLMTIAMAASYDADESDPENIRLPFDLKTCALDEERWANWQAHDPLNMVDQHVVALRNLKILYLDVGSRDQYNIQFGTRKLSNKLEKLGVRHHFEEFDGTHSGMDWRLDISLPLIANALLTDLNMESQT
ncbi:MAG: enterochelin esterase-like enzyme [Lysobacterales bacterium]|jgi:enterochelin esterase-like enzyme